MTEVIINNYFSNKKKRVSFCNDVKDFDGSSDFNSNFFLLCIFFIILVYSFIRVYKNNKNKTTHTHKKMIIP